MVGRPSALLSRDTRTVAAAAAFAALIGWYAGYEAVPRLPRWADVAIAAGGVVPVTFALLVLGLPLRGRRGLLPVGVALSLLAALWHTTDFDVAANFVKLAAATAIAWWFLTYFERVSWVAIVAALVPFVDAVSVWRGPTRHIVTERPEVFGALSYAIPVSDGVFALGLPDVLFFALFLGAADRWGLRIWWTWLAMIASFAVTTVLAVWVDPFGIGGLPALPGLSIAFLVANADLLWRQLRGGEVGSEHEFPRG